MIFRQQTPAPEIGEYSSLSLWGYIDDRCIEGFKTPTFKNGGSLQLQIVGKEDIILGFEQYNTEDDREAVRPNFPLESYVATVGLPAVYFFRPLMEESIVGRRDIVRPKLRQWLLTQDAVAPATEFDILLFIGANSEVIDTAINKLVSTMRFPSHAAESRYAQRLRRISARRLEESLPYLNTGDQNETPLDVNSDIFQDRLNKEIDKGINPRIDDLIRMKNWYLLWAEKNLRGNEHAAPCQVRALFEALASIEDDSEDVKTVRDLLRYTYYLNVLNRLILYNYSLYKNGRGSFLYKININPRCFREVLNAPAADFLQACVKSFLYIPSERSIKRLTPLGSILVGEVSEIKEDEIIIRSDDRTYTMKNSLISVATFNYNPVLGQQILFVVLKNNSATSRGVKYVSQIFNIFFPFDDSEENERPLITMAASNSWSIIEMTGQDKSRILKNKGVLLKQIIEILGLRRITIVKKISGTDPDAPLSRFKDIINSSWSELKILDFQPNQIILECNVANPELVDHRKLRTFFSMIKKTIHGASVEIRFVGPDGQSRICSSSEFIG